MTGKKIRVLVVDDSTLFRRAITDILEKDPGIEVVGTANNGKTAVIRNASLNPDIITMDIEMPIMNGLEALRQIIAENPKPVIMMSVLTQHGADATFKALDLGAVDFVPKPSSELSMTSSEIAQLLIAKIKAIYTSKIQLARGNVSDEKSEIIEKEIKAGEPGDMPAVKNVSNKCIGIGTSTGGPSALISIFKKLPEKFPSPVMVVQHMPEGFTQAFAERLDAYSSLKVKEAEDGDVLYPCSGYIAPGNSHMEVENRGGKKVLRVYKGEKVSGHMPSIDVLFGSIAEYCGRESIGVIMTGMGKDGADGITRIKKQGGYTIAQDENSSVVYGMNRVAVEKGAIDTVVPLRDIPRWILNSL